MARLRADAGGPTPGGRSSLISKRAPQSDSGDVEFRVCAKMHEVVVCEVVVCGV